MEVEAKFRAQSEDTLRTLREATHLAGLPLGPSWTEEFADTYMDTESWQILAGGYFCRRRLSEGRVLITIKQVQAAGGAVHRREELEVELGGYAPPSRWPESAARDKVLELSQGAPLLPMLELRQDRTMRLVGDQEAPIAELSLDAVRLGPSDGAAPRQEKMYFEVEVELKEHGSEDELAAIVAELQTAWGLEPEPRSKFQRALDASRDEKASGEGAEVDEVATAPAPGAAAAAGPPAGSGDVDATADAAATGEPVGSAPSTEESVEPTEESAEAPEESAAQPEKAAKRRGKRQKEMFLGDGLEVLEKPGLKADDTMAEAARKTLLYHLQKMMLHEPGTRDGADPEELHDMRVATRRMRAAMRVFEDYLAMKEYKPFLKVMRQTGRELGAVRDLDVFMIKTQCYIDSLPPEERSGLDPLVEAWRTERERARAELLAFLDDDGYQRFKQKFESFLRVPGAGVGRVTGDDGEPAPTRVGDVLPGVLFDRLALVKAYDGPISQPEAPLAVFHQLRITSKGLRYTLEFFQEVLGTDSKPLIDRTKQVQDHLGDLQDAVVTCDVLLGFLGSGTWGPPRADRKAARTLFPVNAPGVATYLAAKQNEIDRLMRTFGPLWGQMHGSEFSRPLAKLVADL
jgi:CHAD domain-containing protein